MRHSTLIVCQGSHKLVGVLQIDAVEMSKKCKTGNLMKIHTFILKVKFKFRGQDSQMSEIWKNVYVRGLKMEKMMPGCSKPALDYSAKGASSVSSISPLHRHVTLPLSI